MTELMIHQFPRRTLGKHIHPESKLDDSFFEQRNAVLAKA